MSNRHGLVFFSILTFDRKVRILGTTEINKVSTLGIYEIKPHWQMKRG